MAAKKNPTLVVSIRLDELALKAVDLLVEAGLESNRSRAASLFVQLGIQASEELLTKASELVNNVQQLRGELLSAVKMNNLEKVSDLLSRDASLVNMRSDKGETPLLVAIYLRANEMKALLLERGAQLDIYEASALGDSRRVQTLLQKSPELANAYNTDGFLALNLASHFGHEETVQLLLDSGVNVNGRTKDGNLDNMALHASVLGNYVHIAKLLLEYGADINGRCKGQLRADFTPLHVAAFFGRDAMIELFLQYGVDRTAVNADGDTAYALAQRKGFTSAAALLGS
ncbi:ankyrin repeat domain-containing protein [Paenibacillaceae bacterium]|nr:ankyrin repeat domain-containing protein [Paenibacillaceae bacterium]